MRLCLLALLALLSACASPLPAPNPEQAWIDMRSSGINLLMANRLDGKPWPDGRYFQVTPGEHELQMRFQFEWRPLAMNLLDSQTITCYLRIHYPEFAAGQRYWVQADAWLNRAQAWLYDSQGQRLARAQVRNCLPF